MSRPKKPQQGSPALDTLEDAVQLVRGTPAATWLLYYGSTLPFVLGFLFFWSEMSRGAFALDHLAQGSCLLAVAFVLLKTGQAIALEGMQCRLTNHPPEPLTLRRFGRALAIQAALSPAGLIVRPIALLITLPYAWVAAAYHNLVLLGNGNQPAATVWKESIRLAKLWPRQNHEGLSILWLVMVVVWINLAILLSLVPGALRSLLGLELFLTGASWSVLNSTFFFVVCALTYLCMDPIYKAFYAVRVYRGEALTTGADLRSELERLEARPAARSLPALLAFLAAMPLAALRAESAPSPDPDAQEITAPLLDREIDSVLEDPQFAWRLPREEGEDLGILERFFRDTWEALDAGFQPIAQWIADFVRWLSTLFDPADPDSPPPAFNLGDLALPLTIAILAVAVLVILAAAVVVWMRSRRMTPVEAEAVAVARVPDLQSEELVADELPEEEWLRLAREKAAEGEYRLAIRALYLAGLAHLGERELVSLARFKSNLDYEREIRRRTHSDREILEPFHDNLLRFERVWYGRHALDAQGLSEFETNLHRILAR